MEWWTYIGLAFVAWLVLVLLFTPRIDYRVTVPLRPDSDDFVRVIQSACQAAIHYRNKVEIFMTAVRSHYNPEHITVKLGDHVTWRITNLERAVDATHGFAVPQYGINASLEPGETVKIEFVADRAGTFPIYCTEFCSALHLEMMGYFMVEPQP